VKKKVKGIARFVWLLISTFLSFFTQRSFFWASSLAQKNVITVGKRADSAEQIDYGSFLRLFSSSSGKGSGSQDYYGFLTTICDNQLS